MPTPPDRCPLCREPNGCVIAAGATGEIHCWCMQEPSVTPQPGSRERACLCRACVQRLESG